MIMRHNYGTAISLLLALSAGLGYSPSIEIKDGHYISNSATFDANATYLWAVLLVPGILLAAGILSLIFFNVGLLFRCCLVRCKCAPKTFAPYGVTPEVWANNVKRRGKKWGISVLALSVLVIFTDHVIYYGNDQLNQGVSKVKDTVSSVARIFSDLNSDGNVLSAYGVQMRNALTLSSCSQAKSTIAHYLDTYDAAANSFSATAYSAQSHASGANTLIDTYFVYYRQISVYSLYALVVGGAVFIILSQIFGSVCSMKFAIFINNIVFFILIILAAVTMTLSAMTADFCMDPNESVLRVAPVGGSTKSVLAYYTTCKGINPLNQYISNANSSVIALNNSLTALLTTSGSPCASDIYLKTIRSSALGVFNEMNIVQQGVACSVIQPIWDNFLSDSMCGHLYTGWFSLWLVFLVTSFLLFLLLITASISYQYFDFRIEFGGGGYYPQNDAWAAAGPENPPSDVVKYY